MKKRARRRWRRGGGRRIGTGWEEFLERKQVGSSVLNNKTEEHGGITGQKVSCVCLQVPRQIKVDPLSSTTWNIYNPWQTPWIIQGGPSQAAPKTCLTAGTQRKYVQLPCQQLSTNLWETVQSKAFSYLLEYSHFCYTVLHYNSERNMDLLHKACIYLLLLCNHFKMPRDNRGTK